MMLIPGEPAQGNCTSEVLYGFNNTLVKMGVAVAQHMFYSCQERLKSTISITEHSLAGPLSCPVGLPQEPKLPGHKKARLVRLLQEEDLFCEAPRGPSCKFRA